MKKKFKNLLILSLAASTTLMGCQSVSQQEQHKVLNLAFTSDPPTLNPSLAADITSSAVADNLFEGLTRVSSKGQVDLAGAESIEKQDNGRVWIFKLRHDAKWTNGDPVTAKDYVFAWKWVLDPKNAANAAYKLYDIKGAEAFNKGTGNINDVGVLALDDYTLQVTLNTSVQYFDQMLSNSVFFPLHQKTVEQYPKWYTSVDHFVSNGAFQLAEYQTNKHLMLTKNKQYYDHKDVDLDQVMINIIPDENTAYNMYTAGELDVLGSPYNKVSTEIIDKVKTTEEYTNFDNYGLYLYKFNTNDKYVNNIHIRRALSYAINRQDIVTNITKAGEKVALSAVPQFNHQLFKDNNIEQAKKELAIGMKELGISQPQDIKLTISYNRIEVHAKIAQHIQQQWQKELGVNVELNNAEWKVYLDQVRKGQLQIMRAGWPADRSDPANFIDMYQDVKSGDNNTGWHNQQFSDLIAKAKSEGDEIKRNELLKSAEKILIDEAPITPIYFYVTPTLKKSYVKDYQSTLLGNVYLKDVKLDK